MFACGEMKCTLHETRTEIFLSRAAAICAHTRINAYGLIYIKKSQRHKLVYGGESNEGLKRLFKVDARNHHYV